MFRKANQFVKVCLHSTSAAKISRQFDGFDGNIKIFQLANTDFCYLFLKVVIGHERLFGTVK